MPDLARRVTIVAMEKTDPRKPDRPREPQPAPIPLGNPLEPIVDGPEPVVDVPEPPKKEDEDTTAPQGPAEPTTM